MATAVRNPAESRVVLHNIPWEMFEQILEIHANTSSPRFTYDRRELEIMSPLPKHEQYKHMIEVLPDLLALESNMVLDTQFGSTAFRREDLEQGVEPDACFYVRNAPNVRGKACLDLSTDGAFEYSCSRRATTLKLRRARRSRE